MSGKPILTVADSDGFTTSGGVVGFSRDGAKVAFDLNLDAARAAGLNVDPKLVKSARSVKGG